jgi:DNA replication protein DnaC
VVPLTADELRPDDAEQADDLARVVSQVFGEPVPAVAGLAGVGKTALAVHAGHAAMKRGWFGGRVLFIDLARRAAREHHGAR